MTSIFGDDTNFDSISQWVNDLRSKGLKFSPYCLSHDHGELIHSEIFPFVSRKYRKEFLQEQIHNALGDRLKWIVEWYSGNEQEYADSLASDAEIFEAMLVDENNPIHGLFKKRKFNECFTSLSVSPNILERNFRTLYSNTPEYVEAFSKAVEGWRITEGVDGFFHVCSDEFEHGGMAEFIREFANLYRWGDEPIPDDDGYAYDYDFDISVAEKLNKFTMKEVFNLISELYNEIEVYDVSSDRCYFGAGKFFFFVILVGYDKSKNKTEICIFDGWNEL